jgi:hypothetical protein
MTVNTSIVAALAAALLFGASTPFAKALVGALPPVLVAGLLYAGSGRAALRPRRDPYWHRLRQGFYLGFRCTAPGGVGTWIARRLVEGRKYVYKALGEASEAHGFEAALAQAETWVGEVDRGIGASLHGKTATVELACREYVQALRTERPGAAHDAHKRFERTVYGDPETNKAAHPIARLDLGRLRERDLRAWRDQLPAAGLSKASANRTLTALKAALNHAVRTRLAGPQLAFECRVTPPFKGATRRRELFLDQAQRRRLLEAARGAVRDLIEAAALTGARPGELTSLRRSAFDARHGNISFARDNGRHWAHSGDWDEPVREARPACARWRST